jgi:cobalt-zinc-cadmium efflux system protein
MPIVVAETLRLLANSLALLSMPDNLSDVLGLLLAWAAASLAKRLPSARYTYGMRRLDPRLARQCGPSAGGR